MAVPKATVITESYDLALNLVGLYCSYDVGDDQVEYACLFRPGLAQLGAWPPGLAPLYGPVPHLPPVAFLVNHDFRDYAPTWAEFAAWAVDQLVTDTANPRSRILDHVVWGSGRWEAKDRQADAPALIAAERRLHGQTLDRAASLRRSAWGPPIAGAYAEAPTQVELPYRCRVYQMKGDQNTQPSLGAVFYANHWRPETLASFLGDGSPASWKYLQVADWQMQLDYPG